MSVKRQKWATKSHVITIILIHKKPCKHTICKASPTYTEGGIFHTTLILEDSNSKIFVIKKSATVMHRADFFLFYLKILANIKLQQLLKYRYVQLNQLNALNNLIHCHTNPKLYKYYRLPM